jgi:hypothetical protein
MKLYYRISLILCILGVIIICTVGYPILISGILVIQFMVIKFIRIFSDKSDKPRISQTYGFINKIKVLWKYY